MCRILSPGVCTKFMINFFPRSGQSRMVQKYLYSFLHLFKGTNWAVCTEINPFFKIDKKYLSDRTWTKNINTLFLWSMFRTHIIQLFLNPYGYNKKEGELSQMIWRPKAIIRSRPWGDHVTSGQQSDNVRIIHAGTLSIQKNFDEDVWNEKKSWRILWPQWNYLWWICLNIWSGPVLVSKPATDPRISDSQHLCISQTTIKIPNPRHRFVAVAVSLVRGGFWLETCLMQGNLHKKIILWNS